MGRAGKKDKENRTGTGINSKKIKNQKVFEFSHNNIII
jgi:hypothetical protein